ncbi:putative Kunitz-type serine protease inhibitor isoform X2 [Alligator mississippiensis]|uniref:putative Kunitz-type serine protease inhibitor isoform X2 n=1 Tax=Alligator mississippiensis TaxID=8496 RepID=UPI002877EAE9|nr:putative Kunitz-type serine protease inhibitor isoform X2 [Alligator mississippiensis]
MARALRVLLALLALAAARARAPGPGTALPDLCLLPREVGRCRASMPRWWFNATSRRCQPFTFGGCNANLNNFMEEEECRQACPAPAELETSEEPPAVGRRVVQPPGAGGKPEELLNSTSSYEEYCMAPQVTGPCRAAFPRWYHDPVTHACRQFTYGGCRGNKNNHLKEEICLSRCRWAPGKPEDRPNATSSYEEYCMAPQVTGPCRAAFPRWYHDPVTHACRQFTYGGCRGNKNNHLKEEICLSRCRWPPGASGDLDEGSIHSTRAVALAVLLALMAAVLLGSVVVFFAKLCRKGPECAAGHGWSPLDDKEHLMTSPYVL